MKKSNMSGWTRHPKKIEYKGKPMSLRQIWIEAIADGTTEISFSGFWKRVKKLNWPIDLALSKVQLSGVSPKSFLALNGEKKFNYGGMNGLNIFGVWKLGVLQNKAKCGFSMFKHRVLKLKEDINTAFREADPTMSGKRFDINNISKRTLAAWREEIALIDQFGAKRFTDKPNKSKFPYRKGIKGL